MPRRTNLRIAFDRTALDRLDAQCANMANPITRNELIRRLVDQGLVRLEQSPIAIVRAPKPTRADQLTA